MSWNKIYSMKWKRWSGGNPFKKCEWNYEDNCNFIVCVYLNEIMVNGIVGS